MGRTRVLRALGKVVAMAPVLAVLTPICAFAMSAWLNGWQLQVVRSGSMEPYMAVGTLVVVEGVEPADVRSGSVVVFADPARPGQTITHRVVRRTMGEHGYEYVTKGDANAAVDTRVVKAADVRGRVKWQIAGAGNLLDRLQGGGAPLVLVGLPLALLVATELPGAARRVRAVGASRAAPRLSP